VRGLRVQTRMETPAGVILDQSDRRIGADEPLLMNILCQGGCSNGVFLLTDAIGLLLNTGGENREGMGLCQAVSYQDPKLPCGTKFYYSLQVEY